MIGVGRGLLKTVPVSFAQLVELIKDPKDAAMTSWPFAVRPPSIKAS
jgi:hypothetical protein